MAVHFFGSTTDAYDETQWRDDIATGDVLVVASEGVAGVLVDACPIAATEPRGSFHTLASDVTWATLDGGKYEAAAAEALAVLAAA